MLSNILISVRMLIVLTFLTGVLYPVFVTGVGTAIFPYQAKGSLVINNSKIVGSELIGQKFQANKYFWSRPSGSDYVANPSGSSNLGPTSEDLKKAMLDRKKDFTSKNYLPEDTKVPEDMLFASGSGVDPHISLDSALLQVKRIAKERAFDSIKSDKLIDLVKKFEEKPQVGVLGENRVNVVMLNLEIDKI
ncbi:MAG: potassium-transporting ATPase subunit KdpC [Cyanobacteriota bacterium]